MRQPGRGAAVASGGEGPSGRPARGQARRTAAGRRRAGGQRTGPPVRQPGRGETAARAHGLPGGCPRPYLPGRRRFHGGIHRLPAPGGRAPGDRRGRRIRPAPPTTPAGCPGAGAGDGPTSGTSSRPGFRRPRIWPRSTSSFISLALVLPPVCRLLGRPFEMVALVKPQFEVGKGEVGKRGVVRESALHRAVLERVAASATALGCGVRGIAAVSPAWAHGEPRVPDAPHERRRRRCRGAGRAGHGRRDGLKRNNHGCTAGGGRAEAE